MLVPAICYREELLKKFAREIYSDRYFYYMGYGHGHNLPEIKESDDSYQWAIIDDKDETVIGYFAYRVYPETDCVEQFGLYSFKDEDYSAMRNALLIGRDIHDKMIALAENHHRVSWRVVGGNPVIDSYNNLLNEFEQMGYYAHSVVLHDVTMDSNSAYRDEIIYEVINYNKNRGLTQWRSNNEAIPAN